MKIEEKYIQTLADIMKLIDNTVTNNYELYSREELIEKVYEMAHKSIEGED